MKNRWTIDKDKVVFFIILISIIAPSIMWLIHKIEIREWEKQVEEPNTAEDYASDEESIYIENSYDKFIFTGRIDAWPKRIYCFEETEDGEECYYETEELLPIRMEVGDLVKITGEISWGDMGCVVYESVIKSIDSIKFVNEEVYIASIPEINRIGKDYIPQHTTRRVIDPYKNGSDEVVTGWPYDDIYYYYEETDEVIAYFTNSISIDETEVIKIDKKDVSEVSGYFFVKKDGKIYKYEHKTQLIIDGKEEWYYFNGDIPEEERDKVFKRQRNEDIFFKYIVDPEHLIGGEG